MKSAPQGVVVSVQSGDDINSMPICQIGHRQDVKHLVAISTLAIIPYIVECEGHIYTYSNHKVKFSSSGQNVTDTTWKKKVAIPPIPVMASSAQAHVIDHVILLGISQGEEELTTSIVVKGINSSQHNSTFSLKIKVDAQ